MHEALGFLLQHYKNVKLWMGVEAESGAELYLTCSPSSMEGVVSRLNRVDKDFSIFDAPAVPARAAVGE